MDHEQQGPLLARPGAAQELMTADWRVLYCFALPWKSLATDWYSEVDAVGTRVGITTAVVHEGKLMFPA